MLRFDSWPPELGHVEFTKGAVNAIELGWDEARIVGRCVGSLLIENSSAETASAIVEQLSDVIDDTSVVPTGDMPAAPRTARDLFLRGATSSIAVYEKRGTEHV